MRQPKRNLFPHFGQSNASRKPSSLVSPPPQSLCPINAHITIVITIIPALTTNPIQPIAKQYAATLRLRNTKARHSSSNNHIPPSPTTIPNTTPLSPAVRLPAPPRQCLYPRSNASFTWRRWNMSPTETRVVRASAVVKNSQDKAMKVCISE